MQVPVLTDFLPSELASYLAPHGFSAKEARRIFAHQVHHDRRDFLVRDLAGRKQKQLAELFALPSLEVIERRRSDDGFVKYLFRLADGLVIEAVRIPLLAEKYSVCLSSQAGCALACDFCATGRMGFQRNLATWEIVEQLRIIRSEAMEESGIPVRSVVFMGMGEPFLNYERVIAAARIFSEPSGLAISGRAITISTAGVVPAIRRYTAERHPYRLAISLTAATKQKRRSLMPVEDTHGIDELVAAIREHAAVTQDRVMLEYVAISGVNCGDDDAADLCRLLAGIPVRFNLIEVNDASGKYLPPDAAELKRFRDALAALGQPVVRRYSGGKDIAAACGMLAATQQGGAIA